MQKIRLVLVDKHQLTRRALGCLLQSADSYEVVGEAADERTAQEVLAKAACDVAIVSPSVPKGQVEELIDYIAHAHPQVRILTLISHPSEAPAGVHGVVPQTAGEQELFTAVRQLYENGRYHHPCISQHHQPSDDESRATPPPCALSDRQREVLQYVADGQSNPAIAKLVGISESTVKAHLRKIFEVLDVTERVQAVLQAIRLGLISTPRRDSARRRQKRQPDGTVD